MRKPDSVEQALNRLGALRAGSVSPSAIAELKGYIASRVNLVSAKAAAIAGEFQIAELVPDLVTAFDRFMANPHKLDKGCAAITEITGALLAMDYPAYEIYLKGIHHVQIEPAYPTPIDTAANLRARSAMGLVQSKYPDALIETIPLLVDAEGTAAAGAVRAIAAAGGEAAELLLRLKVLAGDRSSEVLGECFIALLALAPERSIPFVAPFTESQNQPISEEAILALGESRHPAAFAILKQKSRTEVFPPRKKTLLLAIATSRLDAAVDFLLSLLASENSETASNVISALAIYRDDSRVRQQVETLILRRAERSLSESFRREFHVSE